MTINEKSREEKAYYKIASQWKTDFVMAQFHLMWECQRSIEKELQENGFGMDYIYRATCIYRVRRSALVRVLKERGEL